MDQRQEATGFFSVIKRHCELDLDSSKCSNATINSTLPYDLYVVPYSQEYKKFLAKAAEFLRKAGDMTSTPRYCINELPFFGYLNLGSLFNYIVVSFV